MYAVVTAFTQILETYKENGRCSLPSQTLIVLCRPWNKEEGFLQQLREINL